MLNRFEVEADLPFAALSEGTVPPALTGTFGLGTVILKPWFFDTFFWYIVLRDFPQRKTIKWHALTFDSTSSIVTRAQSCS